MPIRTAEQARADIGHHFGAIAELAREVHADFRRDCRAIAPLLNSATRASIYRQIFVRKLRDYCEAAKGAHFLRKGQLCLVGLDSKYAFRVKQLSSGFGVAVSPTWASEQYDANEMPGYAADLFDGAAEATLLYLGWALPENAPAEINVYLVCNDARRNPIWAIPLEGNGGDGRGIQEPLPIDGERPGGVRVRVKAPNERKANG